MRMSELAQVIIASLLSVAASSGFWAYIMRRLDKRDVQTEMLVGLAHDRIMDLGMKYIERGYITSAEYENLQKYLYEPYEKLNGNGSAERIMKEVCALPTSC